MIPGKIPTRLAAYYGANFLVLGIHLPFWQIWLDSKGLSVEQIGIIISSGAIMKVLASPVAAQVADKLGERKRLMVVLTILSLFCFSALTMANSFLAILLINGLFFIFWSPNMPLMESLTLHSSHKYKFDYGRVRLWGSITFIIASVGIGMVLKKNSSDYILPAILLMLVLTSLSTFLLPDIRTHRLKQSQLALTSILKDRTFVVFLIATAMIQASHALFYGFGSIHWLDAGIGPDVIGFLWAEGVTIEIILFMFGAPVLARLGASRLIALAGLAGAIRWAGFGLTTDLYALIALQALHGITFGAAHLGAMHFIQNRIATELSATAQSLYSGIVMGIGMGLAMLLSGYLYSRYAGLAYFAMAIMAGFGGMIIFMLRRERH